MQTSAMNSQAIALHKQNDILQKSMSVKLKKSLRTEFFQLRFHLAQATDDSQRFVLSKCSAKLRKIMRIIKESKLRNVWQTQTERYG